MTGERRRGPPAIGIGLVRIRDICITMVVILVVVFRRWGFPQVFRRCAQGLIIESPRRIRIQHIRVITYAQARKRQRRRVVRVSKAFSFVSKQILKSG